MNPVLAVLAILDPCGFETLLRLLNDVNFGQGNLICALRRFGFLRFFCETASRRGSKV